MTYLHYNQTSLDWRDSVEIELLIELLIELRLVAPMVIVYSETRVGFPSWIFSKRRNQSLWTHVIRGGFRST